ncbi:CLUMA_CG000008, isoform A [Clunio marinus]|uniref:CLUMA_CG000008, isoform A n=1 Tax=Clunio marinus TaxID=568069 RepID=A0A1J1HFV2_9DIPT|nr:CLUMA_CG000008, isoform A [Clunio marinus]
MPNEPEKNPLSGNKPTIHTTHQLPIDLAVTNKVIVKPANEKMSIQQTFRTIQQPPTMRVVRMPGTGASGAQIIQTQIMPPTILKSSIPGRSTITVSKSPTTYLPRVTATLSTIQGAKGTQQIRTPTPPASSVAGISPAFVRSITPRTSSPNAVLSQGTTAWVSGSGAMQVQVPQQIIRSTITQNRTITANIFGQSTNQQGSNISVTTTTTGASGQPTYVATVLPQRPQGATIVYTSQQQQPFIQGQVQRMGLTTGTTNPRQIRPIQRIPTTGIRVNTSGLSIRQNVPSLTPTTVIATQNRTNSGLASSTTISNTIPARIFQVQSQQPGGSQIISQSNQKIVSANVMLPIIVNSPRITHSVKNPLPQGIIAHVSKLTSGTVSNDGTIISNSLTNTMASMSNTMVASIQTNQSGQSQVTQGNNQQQGTIYTTQSTQQVQGMTSQGGNQIITVSQQQPQQLISNQSNIHQSGNVQTVVPLAIGSRSGNIPIKTITVSASNSGSLDSSSVVHRNLSSNTGNIQATTIMPITKIVSQQQVVNQNQQNISGSQVNQGTPVYIHTRIPTVSTVASSAQSQVIAVSSSSSTPTYSTSGTPATVYYEQASVTTSTTTPSSSSNEQSYTVASASNIRYNEKMIHSIIATSYQNQAASAQGNSSHIQQQSSSSNPIRFSPLVVENQSGSQNQQSHQIITMGAGNIIQQQQGSIADTATHVIVPISNQVPTSPRGPVAAIRKQNETTPVKGAKKQPKGKNYQVHETLQLRGPQRPQMSAAVAQLTNVKPLEPKQHSTASSPKTIFSERESPLHGDDWSDGSTTVSIPNSPRSEDEDLDALIMSNQFNKVNEEIGKFLNKTPAKINSAVKRESSEQQAIPRTKKLKTERVATDISDSVAETNNENSAENANNKKKDVVLKKPQASLLPAYNHAPKHAHNHFLRYSDVRVRDERKPSVMDLANQPKVAQRVNGWKTHMINAEITEMINDETQEMEKLNAVLKRLETFESSQEAEKASELIKGNLQRSRLIIDSFMDSRTQLLKIFDHKDHASDIINRCASKRNFKKR